MASISKAAFSKIRMAQRMKTTQSAVAPLTVVWPGQGARGHSSSRSRGGALLPRRQIELALQRAKKLDQ
jgi:hypothetical protein